MNRVGRITADAAKTSRAVLYRRWPTMFDLLQDVYAFKAKKLFEGEFFKELKDNGSLRLDLLQLLRIYQEVYAEIGIDVLNNYYYIRMQDKENLKKPAEHVQAVEKHLMAIEGILTRASARGEKTSRVSKITLMLPFDLIRIENLVRIGHFDQARMETIVDEVLLPVYLQTSAI